MNTPHPSALRRLDELVADGWQLKIYLLVEGWVCHLLWPPTGSGCRAIRSTYADAINDLAAAYGAKI